MGIHVLSESELIARGTNLFMEAWKRAANSFVAPAIDALPRSEDELEEEPGAIQPFNRLDCSPVQFKMSKRRSSQTAKAPCWLFGCFSDVSKVSHSRAAWAPAHKTQQSERHLEN